MNPKLDIKEAVAAAKEVDPLKPTTLEVTIPDWLLDEVDQCAERLEVDVNALVLIWLTEHLHVHSPTYHESLMTVHKSVMATSEHNS